jgi:hypothetical protein
MNRSNGTLVMEEIKPKTWAVDEGRRRKIGGLVGNCERKEVERLGA